MMRIKLSLLIGMVATALFLAGNAGADATVDLVWVDGGGSSLTIQPNDAGGAPAACTGFAPSSGERCMLVVLTSSTRFSGFGVRIQLDSSNVSGSGIAQFKVLGNGKVGAVGTPAFSFNGDPNQAGDFTGAAASGTSGIGTFTIGTIVWDTTGATSNSLISSFFGQGQDILDVNANSIPSLLNSAALNIIPEPTTVSLIGLGLVGLGLAGRRRNR